MYERTPWLRRHELKPQHYLLKTAETVVGGFANFVYSFDRLLKKENSKLVDRPRPTELINKKGYTCQIHEVVTSDGYVLTLHRIVPRDGNPQAEPKEVVFLQHGLVDSSVTWIMNGKEDSLGFMLADAGYDVWLGNVRGNVYSNTHKEYDAEKDEEYWDFTWDDMARKDLPAMIDYVLRETGKKDLFYVGHSQGGLIGFVEFSRNAELASKVKHFFALAPAVYLGQMSTPLHAVIDIKFYLKSFLMMLITLYWTFITLPIRPILSLLDINMPSINTLDFSKVKDSKSLQALLNSHPLLVRFIKFFKHVYEKFMLNLIITFWTSVFSKKGINEKTSDITRILPIFKHGSYEGFLESCGKSKNITEEELQEYLISYPSDSSIKNLMHFMQLVRTGAPEGFNYGLSVDNYKMYHSLNPPRYNPTKLKNQYTIYYGSEDALVPAVGIETNYPAEKRIRIEGFNHVDFVWSKNAAKLVYKPILNKLIDLTRH